MTIIKNPKMSNSNWKHKWYNNKKKNVKNYLKEFNKIYKPNQNIFPNIEIMVQMVSLFVK